jgi:hypothetical protein
MVRPLGIRVRGGWACVLRYKDHVRELSLPRKYYALSGRYLRRQFGSTATAAACKSVLWTGERVLRFEQGFNATEQ